MYPNRARSPGASLAAGLLVLGVAAAAPAATYNVRPEVSVEQNFDDNVLSDENEISSWGTDIAPSVSLQRKSETSDSTLQLGVTRRQTHSLSEIDGTDKRAELDVRRALSPRLSVGGRANYQFFSAYDAVEQPTPSGTPQALFADRPELTWNGLATNLSYSLDDATVLTGSLGWNSWTYDRSDRTDLFDNEDGSATLALSRQFTPRDKAGLTTGLSFSDEESSDTGFQPVGLLLASTSIENRSRLSTGIAFWERAWSPRWTTTLQGGVRLLDSESEGQLDRLVPEAFVLGGCGGPASGYCRFRTDFPEQSDSGTGFVGGGTINHAYSDRGRVSLSYTHDTRTGTTSSTGSSAIDIDSFSLSVNHSLSSRVSLSLRGSYLTYDNSSESGGVNSGARTRQHTAEVRLEWRVRKSLTTYTSFNYFDIDQERPSSLLDPERRYARRIFGIGLRYFFDHEL